MPTRQSVYADIALTIGQYLLDRYQPNMKERLIDVSEMTIEKALVRLPISPQLMRASAMVDWTKKDVICRFLSTDVRLFSRYNACVAD